jgi:hypothetical protein
MPVPRALGQHVPHGLIQATRDQTPLRQAKRSQPSEQMHQVRVGTKDRLEAVGEHGLRSTF